MLYKTRAVVLRVSNYSESSVVAQLYTEDFGLQSYLINGVKKPKAKIRMNMLQPLHLLDLVVFHKGSQSLQRIAEARQFPVLLELPYDIVKSSLAIFLNEVLFKVLKQSEGDPAIFHFLQQSILWLDETPSHQLANFHIVFLLHLSRILGFQPFAAEHYQPFFDLEAGVFTSVLPAHTLVLQEPHTSLLSSFLQVDYGQASGVIINKQDRHILVRKLLDYYRLHIHNFSTIKSLEILEEVFTS